MVLLAKLRELFDARNVSLELEDIQAMVLRERPEPYLGTHVLLHVDEAEGGREVLRRLRPHIGSAADWASSSEAWISVALTYPGLVALDIPEDSLQSFPEAFRQGMAKRADILRDHGPNSPENWDKPYGTGDAHIAVSIFADDEDKWKRTLQTAREQYDDLSGVSILASHDFGAQPGSRNPLGFRDLISQPAIEGSGVDPLPGQGRAIKAGEFILGYPSESGELLAMPTPDILGKNGTFLGIRKYQSLVGTFNRFLRDHADSEDEREHLAAKLFGRWRSGAPLILSPDGDDPAIGESPERNNDFTYQHDVAGLCVPKGAHMRRLNPRDTDMALLTDVNIHRIIRRSTTFGKPYEKDATGILEDKVDRGLHFIFMSARAMETLEFLQREWVNDGNFMDLGKERDPIIGLQPDDAIFTVPKKPVRERVHGMKTFNVLKGGEYMFVPSLSALEWLVNGQQRA